MTAEVNGEREVKKKEVGGSGENRSKIGGRSFSTPDRRCPPPQNLFLSSFGGRVFASLTRRGLPLPDQERDMRTPQRMRRAPTYAHRSIGGSTDRSAQAKKCPHLSKGTRTPISLIAPRMRRSQSWPTTSPTAIAVDAPRECARGASTLGCERAPRTGPPRTQKRWWGAYAPHHPLRVVLVRSPHRTIPPPERWSSWWWPDHPVRLPHRRYRTRTPTT